MQNWLSLVPKATTPLWHLHISWGAHPLTAHKGEGPVCPLKSSVLQRGWELLPLIQN